MVKDNTDVEMTSKSVSEIKKSADICQDTEDDRMLDVEDDEAGLRRSGHKLKPRGAGLSVCKLGNVFLFNWGKKVVFSVGPDWSYAIGIYVVSMAVMIPFICWLRYKDAPQYQIVAAFVLHVLHLLAYTLCISGNPGIPIKRIQQARLEQPSLEDLRKTGRTYCQHCLITTEKSDTFHCPDCDVCVENLDHHCPFMTKCVGGGNLCWFYSFLLLTLVCMFYISCISSLHVRKRH